MAGIIKRTAGGVVLLFALLFSTAYLLVSYNLSSALTPPVAPKGTGSILDFVDEEYGGAPAAARRREPSGPLLAASTLSRPWARWWWPGADVETASVLTQLDELKSAGFGGVEIQPFSLGLKQLEGPATVARVLEFDTPRYYETLDALMEHAEDIGMQVYLNHLSGWPAGGPHVPLEASMHEYLFAEERVTGGKRLRVELPAPEPGLNAYAMALFEKVQGFDGYNFARDQEELVSVLAARPVSGERSWNPLDGTDTVVLDPESVVVLDDRVADGVIRWDAPAGEWLIVATYLIPSAEPPVLVASPRSGYVIDHLDPEMLVAHYNYAFGKRTGLDKHFGKAFQGFFNDSLEYKLDVMASDDMLAEFESRKGYDLRPFLPLLAIDGGDNFYLRDAAQFRTNPRYGYRGIDDRVRHDFLTARSEMIIERFVEASADWAERRGLKSRAQSYGFDLDVIRALGANQIPETEQLYAGGSEMFLKMASSGADLYRRDLVSSESFVWKARDYALGPKHLKAAADLLLHSGINQIIYHGVTYRTHAQSNHAEYERRFGEIGWYPWSQPDFGMSFSTNAGPVSPLWDVIPELNEYITRAQSLLRRGEADVDAYIYYPFMGIPTSYGFSGIAATEFLVNGYLPDEGPETVGSDMLSLPFFTAAEDNHDERILWLERLQPVVKTFNERGVTWRFINDHAITSRLLTEKSGRLGGSLPTIVLFDTPSLPVDTARVLASINGVGHQVQFLGETPTTVPGYLDYERREGELRSLMDALMQTRHSTSAGGLTERIEGTLRFQSGSSLRRHSRSLAGGVQIHFLANQGIDAVSNRIRFTDLDAGMPVHWFDPMTGAHWPARSGASGDFAIELAPLQSLVLLVGDTGALPAPAPVWSASRSAAWQAIDPAAWTLSVGGIEVDVENALGDFRDDEALRWADEVLYVARIDVSDVNADERFVLDLGDVDGVAALTVNGIAVPTPGFAPFIADLSDALRPGANTIAVRIRPPLRNSLVKQAIDGSEHFKQHLRHRAELAKGGLKGPVRLGRL